MMVFKTVNSMFQHTAARRRLGSCYSSQGSAIKVSTHSRPKAAGPTSPKPSPSKLSFNTQPPEGGWCLPTTCSQPTQSFNTQPPEGGWLEIDVFGDVIFVSTHSRPKAAGRIKTRLYIPPIGFNTQPPEGGWKRPII